MKKKIKKQCEGWRRYGGAFTMGPVTWEQCKEKATVMVEGKNHDETLYKTLPMCDTCLREAQTTTGVKVRKITPIK